MKGFIIPGGAVGLALVSASLVVNAALSYHHCDQLAHTERRVASSYQARAELDAVLALLAEAEAAQRDFVVTGDPRELGPYEDALSRLGSRVVALKEAADPRRAARLDALEANVGSWLGELGRGVEARRDQGFEGARLVVRSDQGQARKEAVRALVAEMAGEEDDVLRRRLAESEADYQMAVVTTLVAAVLGLGLVGLAYSLYRREAAVRGRGEEALRRRSAQLQKLAEIAARVNAAGDMDSVLRTVTAEARALLGAHQAMTRFTPERGGGQGLAVVSHSGKHAEGPYDGGCPDGSADSARVCEENRSMRLTRAELTARPGGAGPRPPQGWLAAPLIGPDGRNRGLVQLADRREGDFTADDEAILVQLAQMASVAVENARLYEALREAGRRKDEFLATLAHELRNPLAPIRTSLQILRVAGDRAEAVEKVCDVMERQVQQMVRLVDDLLDLSRITRGTVALRKEPAELAAVVAGALETTRPQIEATGHALTVELPPEPVWLEADATRLAQVLANLLNNAAKYTEKGGRIALTAQVRPRDGIGPDEVVVRVTDSGVGIPAELLPRVFDMFTQADRTLDRSQGGLGIGLTLVRTLVELHGGTVEAHSDGPGKGSEFVVRLPLGPDWRSRPPGAAPPTPEARPVPRRRGRLLLVDDNRDGAESLGSLLRMMGYEVRLEYDGPSGLQAARDWKPDVAILDIGLPGLSGYELARRLRQTPEGRDLPLIALTGWGQEEDRRRSQEAGFNAHLVKPVEPEALQALLDSLRPVTPA
jgi:signal transduction histidine kinase/CHASE3 domain sensor protein